MTSNTSTKGRVPTGYAEETFLSEATFRTAHRSGEIAPPSSKKRKREAKGDPGSVFGASAYKGPWAKFEHEKPDAASDEEYGEDEEVEVVYEEDEIEVQPSGPGDRRGTEYGDALGEKESSEFVGRERWDYQGRTYMHVPTGKLEAILHTLAKVWMLMLRRSGYQPTRRHGRHQELYTEEAGARLQVSHEVYHPTALLSR
jgi:pre-mRNA-processing factor 17